MRQSGCGLLGSLIDGIPSRGDVLSCACGGMAGTQEWHCGGEHEHCQTDDEFSEHDQAISASRGPHPTREPESRGGYSVLAKVEEVCLRPASIVASLPARETRNLLTPASYAGKNAFAHHGERVVQGQWLMQPASGLFLGWAPGPQGRQFHHVSCVM